MAYKTLHLVRHAQGFHNVQGEIFLQMKSAWKVPFDGRWKRLRVHHVWRALRCLWFLLNSFLIPREKLPSSGTSSTLNYAPYYEHEDASLTSTGWHQVEQLASYVRNTGIRNQTELVVVSPLTRTLQTASGVFGGDEYVTESDRPPLMVNDVGKSPHHAISGSGSPPFVAMELCRERISQMPCDHRSSTSKCKQQFPGIDFSLIQDEDDKLWSPDSRETEEELDSRTRVFLDWLVNRPEQEIAVVSHGGFLTNLLRKFGDETVNSTMFANCELRTLKLRIGSDGESRFESSSVVVTVV